MIFENYHIVIFKKQGSRSLKVRGWLGLLAGLVVCLSVGANFWLWHHYSISKKVEQRLVAAERALEDRHTQLMAMVAEVAMVQNDLQRIQSFDTKLRVMMDMESIGIDAAMGGASPDDLLLGNLSLHRQELASRKVLTFLRELSEEVRLEEIQQQELMLAMRKNNELLASMPSIWPTNGTVTSTFGYRQSPFTGHRQMHKGLDISARMGTPIYAPARGVVTSAGTDGAYGICVNIRHGGGISTKFGHMQRFVVKVGQIVERGEIIGYVGNTGRVSGPHLHYEVLLNGVPTDPFAYILN